MQEMAADGFFVISKKPGMNPDAREGQVVSCYIITHMKD
jgi:hypothetical protein